MSKTKDEMIRKLLKYTSRFKKLSYINRTVPISAPNNHGN